MTQIFDLQKIQNNRQRARNQKSDFFLHHHCFGLIQGRLNEIKRDFSNPLILSTTQHNDYPTLTPDTESLPLEEHSKDLIISILTLQSVNDLPGLLVQIRRALKPDGAFLFAMAGGESLKETRDCLMRAEIEQTGKAQARFHPMISLQQMAGLMQRAGFALPVIDQEKLHIEYPTLIRALRDVRASGEGLALHGYRPTSLPRSVLAIADKDHPRTKSGLLDVELDLICGIGWAPADSQPQPLKRGSGTTHFSEVL